MPYTVWNKCSRAAQSRDVKGMYMTRSLVEQRVREWIMESASEIDALTAIALAQEKRRVLHLENVAAIDRRIEDVKAKLGRITVKWSSGGMPDSAYDAAAAQLDAELTSLTERRRKASPSPRVEVDPRDILTGLVEQWDDLSILAKRNMLRSVIRQVRINKPTRQGTGVWRERVEIIPTWARV